ncbi:potassium channel family protein [Phytohalomonas tamaricis]|uniref:potassium channel family protein n=1 Tax=Phytohalomonas tamaricis TaxID=2081032 RepID=UPI000D0BC044|nr:TrkA family potassium uptake protein [Phytohalomonas tamaricis]
MSRQFAIIGLGYMGSTVALELRRQHHEVLGIDSDEKRVNAIADQLSHAVIADPSDEKALEELGLDQFDAVFIDIDQSIEASMMCTLYAKEIGVKELWVKAHSDDHQKLLSRLGADHIVHPEYDIGIRVAESLSYHAVLDFIHLGEQDYVVEIKATERLVKQCQSVEQLGLRDEMARVIAIKRGDQLNCHPEAATELQADDRLVMIGKLDALRQFGDKL